MTGTKLRQEGFMAVATFNTGSIQTRRTRAESRAAALYEEGFDARIATTKTPAGEPSFTVYMKRQEA